MTLPYTNEETGSVAVRRRNRRRVIGAIVLLAVVAALALLPPLINGERYRRRIAVSMSQSLGRPVHLDKVSFHLLPMPGMTLNGLVVSENPAFGNEPVITANVVEATLRVSSLWRRQIEISNIRLEVDEFGSGASLNIVRNAAGRWNLEDILMQAAHANTAPTAQRKAGPAPRFPYIEATGARVNLKLGDEKMPFSLTDADFALWLPEPQQWHIRLKGKPSRTDTNASDTGSVTLEGTLGRAATLAEVPLHLTASWAHAQMGEATRLLTGDDQQWRGTVEAGASLTGTVGAANLVGDLHLTDLRRADFVPAELLDVSAHCTAVANLTVVVLTQASCAVPNGGPQPITLTSAMLDLQHPTESAASLDVHAVPLNWALKWARLFTQHIPDVSPVGTIDGTIARAAGVTSPWTGGLQGTLQSAKENGRVVDFSAKPVVFDWRAAPGRFELEMQPVAIRLGGPSQLMVSSAIGLDAYSLHVAGTATAAQVTALGNAAIVPLGNQLAATMKAGSSSVDVDCVRPYDGGQRCVTGTAAVVKKKSRKAYPRG